MDEHGSILKNDKNTSYPRISFILKPGTVESRVYVQVGTQKFGRRTERDVHVKIIFL